MILNLDPATQARIFEPFFTTKPVGEGTGLGLATVYGIVKQSGGHIGVHSEIGRGTTFKIYLPPLSGPAESDEGAWGAPGPGGFSSAGAAILVVEDDVAVRGAVRRLLERVGHRVVEVGDGNGALATIALPGAHFDLVISDMVMPHLSGLGLRQRLQELRPTLPLLLMSGYSEEAITRTGSPGALGPLIEKPFTAQGLLEKVRDLLTREESDG